MPAEDPSKHKYVKYCMHRISMLKFYGVIPVVVFDGGRLPLKADTENERQRLVGHASCCSRRLTPKQS